MQFTSAAPIQKVLRRDRKRPKRRLRADANPVLAIGITKQKLPSGRETRRYINPGPCGVFR